MFDRPEYLNQLIALKDTDYIKVLTGVRRSGKSVLLKLYMAYLKSIGIKEDYIIYINLESFDYQTIRLEDDFRQVIQSLIPNDGHPFYVLIDEVQFVEGWERVVNGLRVTYPCDIVITGSNANLLSGELATLLSGRYVTVNVYPLSFREFLLAKEIDVQSREVDIAYREFEKYGGFPGVVLADEAIKNTILSGIFDSIVLHDIANRGQIRDTMSLKRIISFLADNVGQLINPSKISNVLKSEKLNVSNHTVTRYLDLLQEAYLFFEVRQYDLRGKSYLKTNSKYFIIDNGLRNQAVGFKDGNKGNRLENIVFIELLRRGYQVDIARIDDKEIDFIARKENDLQYIQVTYQLPQSTRETDNLLLIKDNFKKLVVTGRYEETSTIDGIDVLYIVDWLLQENDSI